MEEYENRDRYLNDYKFRSLVDLFIYMLENGYATEDSIWKALVLAQNMAHEPMMRSYFFSEFCETYFGNDQSQDN
ncbi:MAG: hypothetical protein RBR97_20695 [Bacteroidales bacterium]|nr:hypothetical protein [Bacteroidales bacterium]